MPGDDEEADFIADEILGEKSAVGREWEDFAVLFRTNYQSRKLELALRDRKIPYRMVGAQSFYDRKEIRDILAYAALLVSPENDVPCSASSTPRTVASGKPPQSSPRITLANKIARSGTLSAIRFSPQLGTKAGNAIEDFVALISGAKNRIDLSKEHPADVLAALLKEIDYLPWIERGCKSDAERQQRGEAIHSLVESLRQHIDRGKNSNPSSTIPRSPQNAKTMTLRKRKAPHSSLFTPRKVWSFPSSIWSDSKKASYLTAAASPKAPRTKNVAYFTSALPVPKSR